MSKSSSENRRGFFNEIFVFDKCEILNDKAVQCEISCFAGCEIFARKRANVIVSFGGGSKGSVVCKRFMSDEENESVKYASAGGRM